METLRVSRRRTPDRPAPWDLTSLDAGLVVEAMTDLRDFVDDLVDAGIDVPCCWYVHGWVRDRLAAVGHWRREAYGASPRSAAEWWSHGVGPLLRDWEPLLVHGSLHPDPASPYGTLLPLPSFDDVVAELAAAIEAR